MMRFFAPENNNYQSESFFSADRFSASGGAEIEKFTICMYDFVKIGGGYV